MSDKMREGFVTWALSEGYPITLDMDGYYACDDTNAAWQAWQASHAAAMPPGFVAVPVEPTPRMQAEAWDGIEKASWFGMNYNEAARKIWADMLATSPDTQP